MPSLINISHMSSIGSPFASHLHTLLQSLPCYLVLVNHIIIYSFSHRYCFSVVTSKKLSLSKPGTIRSRFCFVLIKSTGFTEKVKICTSSYRKAVITPLEVPPGKWKLQRGKENKERQMEKRSQQDTSWVLDPTILEEISISILCNYMNQ